jgi:hypothetical protein
MRAPYKQEVARSSRAPPIAASPLLTRNGYQSNNEQPCCVWL